jgi:predicted transcriptional regulator of viral defense system
MQSPKDFYATHPVFTHREFQLSGHGERSPSTTNNLLAQRVASGRLLRVRKGLYAVVPQGISSETFTPDPYLLATRLRDDAVVAYHAALSFHGRSYSVWRRFAFTTADRAPTFRFRGLEFVPVRAPKAVRGLPEFGGGILVRPHAGGEVRVTSLERCLVDVLDAPQHGGGWEEIWRSLEMIEFVDTAKVVELALLMGSALTVARVGFFLEQHREAWMVDEAVLRELEEHAPAQPRYLDVRRESGTLVSRWNLVVPDTVLHRRWEEP